jgi:C-terminal processing protease CtpA/Prc
MKLFQGIFILFLAVFASRATAENTNSFPQFDEVFRLLRANSGGISDAELNRAAVKGLLDELPSRVVLVTNSTDAASSSNLLSKVSVLEKSFGYFRAGTIETNFDEKFESAYKDLAATNKLKGLVLDLRFAGGTDYSAAAKTADLFIKKEQPLLSWGDASANSSNKTNAISLPLAILVNHETSGASEALAAMLRDADVGLVLGTNTAGQASVFKEFPLANGQILKIASTPVKLGNGREIPANGLKPDIEIAVSASNEKAFYENPFREKQSLASTVTDTNNPAANSQTNRSRGRLNEAELVRLHREGLSPDSDFLLPESSAPAHPAKPVITDPSLVRALDLLKGLSVIQQSRKF